MKNPQPHTKKSTLTQNQQERTLTLNGFIDHIGIVSSTYNGDMIVRLLRLQDDDRIFELRTRYGLGYFNFNETQDAAFAQRGDEVTFEVENKKHQNTKNDIIVIESGSFQLIKQEEKIFLFDANLIPKNEGGNHDQ